MKLKHVLACIGIFFALVIGFTVVGHVVGIIGETAQVAHDEFGPKAALEKYEHFKDVSAQLDAKVADIQVYESRVKALTEQYSGVPRAQWTRDDRENYNQWTLEVAGIKASYNQLAAEYNADMAKFNYRFANQGDLPAGATKALPREYKPYVVN